MDRTKTLLKYALWVIIVYIVSNILIWGLLKVSYKEMKDYKIDISTVKITIMEARASARDGYIKGKINNFEDKNISNKYIKIDLFSERDVKLGTKYIKIENMEAYDIYEFEVKFKIENVDTFEMTMTDTRETDNEDVTNLIINSVKNQKLEYPNN